jgi:hypothetical protein
VIVLDEQLLGRQIEIEVGKWYRGKVCFITDLRPGTVIKDEAVSGLLRQTRGSTFVTIQRARLLEADSRRSALLRGLHGAVGPTSLDGA